MFNQIILGCDFLSDNRISCLFDFSNKEQNDKLKLFSEIASTDIIDKHSNDLKDLLVNTKIDFDENVKKQLIATILEVEETNFPSVDDNYYVKVRLKDDSPYRYSPRRFAWIERLKIREIVDDLLQRNIIKESNSEYCARIVPVKKRNGNIRGNYVSIFDL